MDNPFTSLRELIFPRRCMVCGTLLGAGEESLCLKCNIRMPRTGYHLQSDNAMERRLWGLLPLRRASALFFYERGNGFSNLLKGMKYEGRRDACRFMGHLMGRELMAEGFFEGVDVIVPVPLHPRKQRMRGYNQSELLAAGLSHITGLPVDASLLVRHQNTPTQTRLSGYERWENMSDGFHLLQPGRFAGKHILLVDDVFTTGATIVSCADAFAEVDGVTFSVLTLAIAIAGLPQVSGNRRK